MNRRRLLTAIAASAAGYTAVGGMVRADDQKPGSSGVFKISPNNSVQLGMQSTPVYGSDCRAPLL